jgi:phospholipid/cholesterol/gamma-HCH transport system substrate-binding protein
MTISTRSVGVGVFVVGGLLLFALGLFMIGDRRFLFADRFEVNAEFAQVAGLQDGAAVRVNGMVAGEVTAIDIPPSPAGRFRVRMRLQQALNPLVRQDAVASIRTDGIVGGRFVQIDAGSEQAAAVADGGTIKAREPFDFADLLDRGTETIDNVNMTIAELRRHLDEVVGLIRVTATNANELVNGVSNDVETIGRAGRRLSEEATRLVEGIRAGKGTIGKLVNDDELYSRIAGIAAEAEQAAKTARVAADGARAAIARLQGSGSTDGAVQAIVGELRQTLSNTRDAMSNLEENTEALKRNVLVRGFFDERGFYDLNAITASDYREGALAGKHRDPIRIWLRGDLLFETAAAAEAGAAAPMILSREGRVRLDRAMAEMLRYPKDTPLVVEGYAAGATRDSRFRAAAERSRLVREYIITRYGWSPTLVASMPLGEQPIDGPNGAEWDGVSLAAWVDRRALSPPSTAAPGGQ